MAEEQQSLITDEIKALVGVEAPPQTMWGTISADAVRRFTQALMDDDPIYWDAEYVADTKYGAVVCPPLYPGFTSRRPPGTPDPLDVLKDNPNWDGMGASGGAGNLPPVVTPLPRRMNGGVEAEFFQLAKVGDQVTARRRYKDITDRTGRSGYMVIVQVETEYRNQDDELLYRITNTYLHR
jgi:hydroxyacyl-ACP dehydratase HTD2-like protein with hotdog domain